MNKDSIKKIQAINAMRITNRGEAMAYLQSMQNIIGQILALVQKDNLADLSIRNRVLAEKRAIEQQPEATAPIVTQVVAPVTEVPQEEIEEKLAHSEEDIQSRIDILKSAKKK